MRATSYQKKGNVRNNKKTSSESEIEEVESLRKEKIKPIVEESDDPIIEHEEKLPEEVNPEEVESEESEEVGLDDEDLDPFGDKWEQ